MEKIKTLLVTGKVTKEHHYRKVNGMLVQLLEWAATGRVTLKAPDRSGENRFRTWPYYNEASYTQNLSVNIDGRG